MSFDDDYDSGDDLLADVDADELVASSPAVQAKGEKRTQEQCGIDEVFSSRPSKSVKTSESQANEAEPDVTSALAVARDILRNKFKLQDFRHEQEQAIVDVLCGHNTLVIFPTGAGKSLCYQIPAVAFETLDQLVSSSSSKTRPAPGVSIIVSPLIALMKDQTDALKRLSIAADCSDSTKSYEEQQSIADRLYAGKLRLLYCSPEKLNNEGFVQRIKHVPGGVRMVAVDEAHCVSEWGHSFRPDYLKVARFAAEIGAERTVCLTATATPEVAKDICDKFGVGQKHVYHTSPYRPNLQLLAEATATKKEKQPKLCEFLRTHEGSTLVYVTLQKQAEQLAADLTAQNIPATAYHAGMAVHDRLRIQDAFMRSRVRIVVATIAFGMGIDKPDIRNVVHWDLASTVEEYSQQIGRAGRDGKPSFCMFYICPEDFYIRENFARGDLPSWKSLRGLLQDIFTRQTEHAPDGEVIKLGLNELGADYDIRDTPLRGLLATLELRFGLLRAVTPEYTKYQFTIPDAKDYARARGDTSAAGKCIMEMAKTPTKAGKTYHFDMAEAVRQKGLLRSDLVNKLNAWHEQGVIVLKASGVLNRYRVLKTLPAQKAQVDEITTSLHTELQTKEEDALRRTQQVADLITGAQCFAVGLARHFGMALPDGKRECGHCTYCNSGGQRVVMPEVPAREMDWQGIQRVLRATDVRDDARFLARVAFGIKSPRVRRLKLDRSGVFMSLADHEFHSLMREFTKACEEAGGEVRVWMGRMG